MEKFDGVGRSSRCPQSADKHLHERILYSVNGKHSSRNSIYMVLHCIVYLSRRLRLGQDKYVIVAQFRW